MSVLQFSSESIIVEKYHKIAPDKINDNKWAIENAQSPVNRKFEKNKLCGLKIE